MYYAQAVDLLILLILPAPSSITSEKTNATEKTEEKVKRILDYLATKSYEMILNIHSDVSSLSKARARSRVARYFYMGANPVD